MSGGTCAKITAPLFVLTALLIVIGYVVGWYFFGDPTLLVGLALVLAAAVNFVSYYYSDPIVLRMNKAKIIQEKENPTLFRVVRSVARKASIPMPRVGIVDSPQPNAFATGKGPDRAVVCATSSILRTFTPDELEAVIGHEIGHVVHRDVLMSGVAATLAGPISYIGQIVLFFMSFGGWKEQERRLAARSARDYPCAAGRQLRPTRDKQGRRIQRGRVRSEAHEKSCRSSERPPKDIREGADQAHSQHPQEDTGSRHLAGLSTRSGEPRWWRFSRPTPPSPAGSKG